jgi:hypothetical protein
VISSAVRKYGYCLDYSLSVWLRLKRLRCIQLHWLLVTLSKLTRIQQNPTRSLDVKLKINFNTEIYSVLNVINTFTLLELASDTSWTPAQMVMLPWFGLLELCTNYTAITHSHGIRKQNFLHTRCNGYTVMTQSLELCIFEENIWTEERWSDRRLEKTAQSGAS